MCAGDIAWDGLGQFERSEYGKHVWHHILIETQDPANATSFYAGDDGFGRFCERLEFKKDAPVAQLVDDLLRPLLRNLQFSSSTPMGRLTLNILLSFADYAEHGIMQSPSAEVVLGLHFVDL